MYSKLFKLMAAGLATINTASASFDPNGSGNFVLYWGQASAGSQDSLKSYCDKDAGDVFVISFLSSFGQGTPTLTVSGCDGQNCPEIGEDIKHCQKSGKKVLLSLGGAAGSYGFEDDSQGEQMADTLWNMYAGGDANNRPFGDAQVDGFDLDVENHNQNGYVAMVNKLNKYYKDAEKDYYTAAAPQCVLPDASLSEVMEGAQIDMAFVQFYNNPCAIGKQFNWDDWVDYVKNKAHNKNMKLYLGLPGSQSAAGSGYVDPEEVHGALQQIGDSPQFGGIMSWDASQAFDNVIGGKSFAVQIKNMINSGNSLEGGSSGGPDSGNDDGDRNGMPTIVTGGASNPSSLASSIVGNPSSVAGGVVSSALDAASAPGPTTTVAATEYASQTSVVGQVTSTAPAAQNAATSMAASYTTAKPVPTADSSSSASADSAAPSGAAGQPVNSANIPSQCKDKQDDDLTNCLDTDLNSKKPEDGESCDKEGDMACKDGKFAVCNFNKWVVFDCPAGTTCSASSQGSQAFVGCTWEKNSKRDNLAIGASSKNNNKWRLPTKLHGGVITH